MAKTKAKTKTAKTSKPKIDRGEASYVVQARKLKALIDTLKDQDGPTLEAGVLKELGRRGFPAAVPGQQHPQLVVRFPVGVVQLNRPPQLGFDFGRIATGGGERFGVQADGQAIARRRFLPSRVGGRDPLQLVTSLIEQPREKHVRLFDRGIDADGIQKRVDRIGEAALAISRHAVPERDLRAVREVLLRGIEKTKRAGEIATLEQALAKFEREAFVVARHRGGLREVSTLGIEDPERALDHGIVAGKRLRPFGGGVGRTRLPIPQENLGQCHPHLGVGGLQPGSLFQTLLRLGQMTILQRDQPAP